MALTGNQFMRVYPTNCEVDEDADVSLDAAAEAIALTVPTDGANLSDFVYSATAEDNGTAGILDAQPGITYGGPDGGYVRVTLKNVDVLEHAIIAVPEATDTVALAVYKNSELQDVGDEGFATQNEIAIEMNMDTIVGPLANGDVIRVALARGGKEETASWDVAAAGTLTLA